MQVTRFVQALLLLPIYAKAETHVTKAQPSMDQLLFLSRVCDKGSHLYWCIHTLTNSIRVNTLDGSSQLLQGPTS